MVYQFYKKLLRKYQIKFLWLALASISAPFIALLVPIRPESIDLENWFARSGAAMVVLALLSETYAIKMLNIFNPSGTEELGLNEFRQDYFEQTIMLNRIAFLLIAIGTLIWGYGDLWVSNA